MIAIRLILLILLAPFGAFTHWLADVIWRLARVLMTEDMRRENDREEALYHWQVMRRGGLSVPPRD